MRQDELIAVEAAAKKKADQARAAGKPGPHSILEHTHKPTSWFGPQTIVFLIVWLVFIGLFVAMLMKGAGKA